MQATHGRGAPCGCAPRSRRRERSRSRTQVQCLIYAVCDGCAHALIRVHDLFDVVSEWSLSAGVGERVCMCYRCLFAPHAPRIVLFLRSEYFRKLLQRHVAESDARIVVAGLTASQLKRVRGDAVLEFACVYVRAGVYVHACVGCLCV